MHRNFAPSQEHEHAALERFIPIETMKGMVMSSLSGSGRIDEQGIVQPYRVKRTKVESGMLVGRTLPEGERHDIFVASPDQRRAYLSDNNTVRNQLRGVRELGDVLYSELIDSQKITLSDPEVDGLIYEIQALAMELEQSPEYTYAFKQKSIGPPESAIHIHSTAHVAPDFAKTRVYVPGGINAVGIMRNALKEGVHVDYAKLWVPETGSHEQYFRKDTPIFEVTTYAQLESITATLRKLAGEGKIPKGPTPLAGHELNDLPGVYIGQTEPGESFNKRIKEVFGSAIQQVCEGMTNIRAGMKLDDATLSHIAEHARTLAYTRSTTGSDEYAFLKDQPVAAILRTAMKR